MIHWSLLWSITTPLVMLVAGALVNRYFERRPKLYTHYGHISTFRVRTDKEFDVFTHSIVIRNAGNSTATGICIGHNYLPPNYQIYPAIAHEIRKVPDTGNEIYIPSMVAKEQLTISYLYYPPTTFNQINTYVKSEEGHAHFIEVLLQPRPPKWILALIWLLMIVGAITLIYLFLIASSSFSK